VHPLIRAARTAQTRAVRAALRVGPAHPRTRLLLAAAAVAATAAWEAGHHVADVHPAPARREREAVSGPSPRTIPGRLPALRTAAFRTTVPERTTTL